MGDRTYSHQEVQEILAINSAEVLREASLSPNSAIQNDVRNRIAALVSGGYDFADTLHNVYADYGYPAQVTFFNFWNMYRRFGIAKNVVEVYPELGWMDPPVIKTSSGTMKDIQELVDRLGLWTRIKGLDTRQRLGQYAGMFMRVKDSQPPDQPISGKLSGSVSLMDMIPLYESQLGVVTTDDDVQSETYGQPTMYEFRGHVVGSRNPDTNSSFNIHPDRIVIASEESDNRSIYGISSLEPVFNSLMDLRKIIGAGGEGFYKNAAQSIVFDVKDAQSAKRNKDLLDEFNEQYDDFAKNRSRRSMWTPGMTATALESHLINNPKDYFMNALNDVASGSKVPATILVGQQTGRLASDQDSKSMLANVQSRRENFQVTMVKSMLDWMIKFGIIASSSYEITFPNALALSEGEKLDNATKMSAVNKTQFESGGNIPFTGEEVREKAGFEPMEGDLEDSDLEEDKLEEERNLNEED